MKVYSSISELVGHTPLVQLQRFAAARGLRQTCWPRSNILTPRAA